MKITNCFFFLLLIAEIGNCQSTIEGVIFERQTKKFIPLVNIIGSKGIRGTISNEEGKFKLTYQNEADSLIISHINYLTVKLAITKIKLDGGKIYLQESAVTLEEIPVEAKEDDALLTELIAHTKTQLNLPIIARLYYREWVKENKSYNRFADGLLDVIYGLEDKDLTIRVDQSRAYKLPKEDDEMFEVASPVKIETILNNQYINFLNRFGKKKDEYHFYAIPDSSNVGGFVLVIDPKKVKLKESEDRVFYKALIKADSKKNITEVVLELDSMSNYDKSILGLKLKVVYSKLTFKFINQDNTNYLSYARGDFTLQFTFRNKIQIDNYTSEFLLLSASHNIIDIPKGERYKKSSLYKNGNKFISPFWEEANMPLTSKEEIALLEQLKSKQ